MMDVDTLLINDYKMISAMSAAERFAAQSLEKIRAYNLRERVFRSFEKKRKVVAICMVKNEESYLLEWIAYHRLMGVNGFLIFDNDSTDKTPEILSAMHEAGVVCAVPWPTVHPYEKQQISAFANGIRALQAAKASEWAGFLDVDEFYVSRRYGTLTSAMQQMPAADAYHLTWLFYGSSGLESWTKGLTIERFLQRATREHGKNWLSKPLMNLSAVTGHFHHPHNVEMREGSAYLLPNGAIFPGDLPNRNTEAAKEMAMAKANSMDDLCIHHYAVRSKEEFSRKVGKGRVNYRINENPLLFEENEEYFRTHDINDERDEVLLRIAPEVRLEMKKVFDECRLQGLADLP